MKILAPLRKTSENIIAIGLNYKKQKVEFTGNDKNPEHPIFFTKALNSIIGHNDNVNSYSQSMSCLNYELR